MAEIRTFIAIAVDPVIITRLAGVQQQLRAAGADVGWTRPEGMHITLKFLGNVPQERMPAIGEALDAVAVRFAPFTISVEGTGGFPTVQRPRVLWAGIRAGSETLTAMAAAVDDALAALDFPRDARPFRAHLTLGRVKSPANLSGLSALLEAHARDSFGEMTAADMLLMRSELSPQGARYTALHRAGFAENIRGIE